MTRLSSLPRRVWNSCNYDEMKLLAIVLGDRFADEGDGQLLDVGAHFGSSCYPYLERGWRVVALEPDVENRRKLELVRNRFPSRLSVIDKAASDVEATVPFFSSTTSSGISSLHAFHETHEESDEIQTIPLRVLLDEENLHRIGMLKIDVEGHEMTVLRSMNWSVRPRVVVCEFDETKQLEDGPSADSICDLLGNVGYRNIVLSEWFPVVEYGQHHRPKRLIDSTTSVADSAWGNVIAFANEEDQAAFIERAEPLIARSRAAQPLTRRIHSANRSLNSRLSR